MPLGRAYKLSSQVENSVVQHDRFGSATHIVISFEDSHFKLILAEQLACGGEPRESGPDDDNPYLWAMLLVHILIDNILYY